MICCKDKFVVLDLFCGAGGLSNGFEQAGFDIIAGIDNWQDALQTFAHNHKNAKAIKVNLTKATPQIVGKQLDSKHIDVIIGGPPCQGFSIAGKRIIEDERNQLYKSFVSFVAFYKPKAFVLENVPNILAMGGGIIKEQIINDFENLGYGVSCKILLASDFGVPQNRKRAFFVGIQNNVEFIFPNAISKEKVTAKEAISDLPNSTLEDGSNYPISAQSAYQELMRKESKGVFNHQITLHKEKTIKIIDLVPDGGCYKDLPEELQQTRRVNIAWTRLNSNKPSFTIDTGHNHDFNHLQMILYFCVVKQVN